MHPKFNKTSLVGFAKKNCYVVWRRPVLLLLMLTSLLNPAFISLGRKWLYIYVCEYRFENWEEITRCERGCLYQSIKCWHSWSWCQLRHDRLITSWTWGISLVYGICIVPIHKRYWYVTIVGQFLRSNGPWRLSGSKCEIICEWIPSTTLGGS